MSIGANLAISVCPLLLQIAITNLRYFCRVRRGRQDLLEFPWHPCYLSQFRNIQESLANAKVCARHPWYRPI